MADVTITLDEELFQGAERRAARRGCTSLSDYIELLVRDDILEEMRDEIEAKLLEAAESPANEMTREEWDELKRRAWEGHAARTAS